MTKTDIVSAERGQARGRTAHGQPQSRMRTGGQPPPWSAPASFPDGAKLGELWRSIMVAVIAGALLVAIGWHFVGGRGARRPVDLHELTSVGRLTLDAVARRIVVAESTGDQLAKNERSGATGAGQFLEATWLDVIRTARPDLAGRPQKDILDLRNDPNLSREIVSRFVRRNAAMLASHHLPVTAGTIYLSHFAGGAGAVALLTAPGYADAATTMAKADTTGRTTREMIVKANPFLERFTVADLRRWADRKMRQTPQTQ